MKLYAKLRKLSQWLCYQATYHEMKYHLKQVLKGKETKYLRYIHRDFDRGIGKSAALARLSAEYSIPVIVPTCSWKETIEKDIPNMLPKYFRYKKPIAIPEMTLLPDMRFNVILVEEGLSREIAELASNYSYGKVVGFKSISIKEILC